MKQWHERRENLGMEQRRDTGKEKRLNGKSKKF